MVQGNAGSGRQMDMRLPAVAGETVAARLAALRHWQRQLRAVQETGLRIDDTDRFERTRIMIEANILLARHQLENAPPEDRNGVTLLLRYGLSVTNDPCLAAIIKSCLVTLLDMTPPPHAGDAEEIPDEAFDAAVDWPDPIRARNHTGPLAR
jgi:hypothetical protein